MNVYVPQAGDIVAPGITSALTEFWGRFTGACGQAATDILTAAQGAIQPSGTALVALTNDMISRGLASSSGVTSTQALASELNANGISASVLDNWRMALGSVSQQPVALLLQQAGKLPGETPGLLGHFISVVGIQPSTGKYIVSDPNSAAAKQGKFVLYSTAQLAAADPVNALRLNPTGGGPAGLTSILTGVGATVAAPLGGIGTILGSVLGGAHAVTNTTPGGVAANQQALNTPASTAPTDITAQFIGDILSSFGLSSLKDLGIRFVLIVVAILFIFGAILALVFNAANQNKQQVVEVAGAAAQAGAA